MNSSKVTHGICIGDTWLNKVSGDNCVIKNIMIACGGNPLIFFIENGEDKIIEFADKFCEKYQFNYRS